jgi:hypothetical protein
LKQEQQTGIGEIRSAGFTPNAIVIHPQEEAKLLQLTQFITAYQLDPTGEIKRTGQIGQILGIPVYSTPKANQGYMYVLDTNNAYALGIWQDLEIENYDDPLEGLVEHKTLTLKEDGLNLKIWGRDLSQKLFHKLTNKNSWSKTKIKTILQEILADTGLTVGEIQEPSTCLA